MVSSEGQFLLPRFGCLVQTDRAVYRLQGFICIPKSVSQARIKSNTDLFNFELSAEEVKKLDALDEYLITDWDVTETP